MTTPLIEATSLSHEWFEWLLLCALNEAVEKHGDAGRMVAWTVRERFMDGLPRGSFEYLGSDAFPLNPAAQGDG